MYGRSGELNKLYRDIHDFSLPKIIRHRADIARQKILAQMKDSKLMRMRVELIQATKAGDEQAAKKVQQRMRHYQKQDMETGI